MSGFSFFQGDILNEVAPPGWEGTVQKMKDHPEIDNPFALAWWMSDNGDASHEADLPGKWAAFSKAPNREEYAQKYGKPKEANAASSNGQLMKPKKPLETVKGSLVLGIRLLEAGAVNETTREVPVLIIKEGMGNKVDRHFYSHELLQRIAQSFNGVKAYADHPSKTEESDRPERSIKDIVGYYHSPKFVEVGGSGAIEAILKINDGTSYDWAWDLVKEAVAYSGKFKDKDLVGISINAYGSSHVVEMGNEVVNMVDDLTEVQSADIVTQAGAGGGFRLREAVKRALTEGNLQGEHHMKDLLQKHGEGLQGLRSALKSDPAHEKAYGPAMDALMGHHQEMMKQCEAYEAEMAAAKAPPAAPAEPPKAPEGAPKPAASGTPAADALADDGVDEAKKKEEAAAAAVVAATKLKEAETKIRENVAMIEKAIKESGIPEAYTQDLKVLCAGKTEADVKTLVEGRKAIVAPLLGNRAEGAGAAASGKPDTAKFKEALAKAGVPLK